MFLLDITVDVLGVAVFDVRNEFPFRPTIREIEAKIWELIEGNPELDKVIESAPHSVISKKRVFHQGRWRELIGGSQLQKNDLLYITIETEITATLVTNKTLETEAAKRHADNREHAIKASKSWMTLKEQHIDSSLNDKRADWNKLFTSILGGSERPELSPQRGTRPPLPFNLPRSRIQSPPTMVMKDINVQGITLNSDNRISSLLPPASRHLELFVGQKILSVDKRLVNCELFPSSGTATLIAETAASTEIESEIEQQLQQAEKKRQERRKSILHGS